MDLVEFKAPTCYQYFVNLWHIWEYYFASLDEYYHRFCFDLQCHNGC